MSCSWADGGKVARRRKRKLKVADRDARLAGGIPRDFLPLLEEWPPEFYKQQLQFVAAVGKYKEIVFIAGNGSGKSRIFYWALASFLCGAHPLQEAIGEPPLRFKVLIVDFEHGMQKVARETLFEPTWLSHKKKEIGPMFPASMVEKLWTKEDKTLYLKNGSRVEFMTSGQPRKQHSGTNFDALFCDEEPEEDAYDESKRGLRTAKGGGRIFWAFTPPFEASKGPSWSKYKIFDPWREGLLQNTMVIRATIFDNPAVSREYIDWFSQGKTEEQLRVQLYGDYPTWGRLIFPKYDDTEWNPETCTGNLLPTSWEIPWDDEDGLIEFAIDWHPSKPAAALWTYEYRSGPSQGDVVVFDELSPQVTADKTILELSEAIKRVEGEPFQRPKIYRYGDPKMRDKSNALITGFNAWEAFRHAGIFLREAYNRQPEVGISVMNDFISGNKKNHPRLFVRENCVNLRRSLRNHFWTSEGKPDPKWSDYPICLRYILQRKARRLKKGMMRTNRRQKWPYVSYGNDPRFGPYTGAYIGSVAARRG